MGWLADQRHKPDHGTAGRLTSQDRSLAMGWLADQRHKPDHGMAGRLTSQDKAS